MKNREGIVENIYTALSKRCFKIGSYALFSQYNDIDIVALIEDLPLVEGLLKEAGFKEKDLTKYFHIPLHNSKLYRIKGEIDLIFCEKKEFSALLFSITKLKHMAKDGLSGFLKEKENRVLFFEQILDYKLSEN